MVTVKIYRIFLSVTGLVWRRFFSKYTHDFSGSRPSSTGIFLQLCSDRSAVKLIPDVVQLKPQLKKKLRTTFLLSASLALKFLSIPRLRVTFFYFGLKTGTNKQPVKVRSPRANSVRGASVWDRRGICMTTLSSAASPWAKIVPWKPKLAIRESLVDGGAARLIVGRSKTSLKEKLRPTIGKYARFGITIRGHSCRLQWCRLYRLPVRVFCKKIDATLDRPR